MYPVSALTAVLPNPTGAGGS